LLFKFIHIPVDGPAHFYMIHDLRANVAPSLSLQSL
jgi:hypothetical protein